MLIFICWATFARSENTMSFATYILLQNYFDNVLMSFVQVLWSYTTICIRHQRACNLFQAFSYSGRSSENSGRKNKQSVARGSALFYFFARCFLRCTLINWTPGRGYPKHGPQDYITLNSITSINYDNTLQIHYLNQLYKLSMLILYTVQKILLSEKQDSNISSYHAGFLMTMWKNEHGRQIGTKSRYCYNQLRVLIHKYPIGKTSNIWRKNLF